MSKFGQWLRQALEEARQSEYFTKGSPVPVAGNEVVIGAVEDPDVRALYALRMLLEDQLKTITATNYRLLADKMVLKDGDTETQLRLEEKIDNLSRDATAVLRRGEAVDNLFWTHVHEEFHERTFGKTVAIRRGWHVVIEADDDSLSS